MKRLEQGWAGYQHAVIPVDASRIQIKETKRAFYAGAWTVFDVLMAHLLTEYPESELNGKPPKGLERLGLLMGEISAELRDFNDLARRNKA